MALTLSCRAMVPVMLTVVLLSRLRTPTLQDYLEGSQLPSGPGANRTEPQKARDSR